MGSKNGDPHPTPPPRQVHLTNQDHACILVAFPKPQGGGPPQTKTTKIDPRHTQKPKPLLQIDPPRNHTPRNRFPETKRVGGEEGGMRDGDPGGSPQPPAPGKPEALQHGPDPRPLLPAQRRQLRKLAPRRASESRTPKALRKTHWMDEIHFAPPGNRGKNPLVSIHRGTIILGGARISSIVASLPQTERMVSSFGLPERQRVFQKSQGALQRHLRLNRLQKRNFFKGNEPLVSSETCHGNCEVPERSEIPLGGTHTVSRVGEREGIPSSTGLQVLDWIQICFLRENHIPHFPIPHSLSQSKMIPTNKWYPFGFPLEPPQRGTLKKTRP